MAVGRIDEQLPVVRGLLYKHEVAHDGDAVSVQVAVDRLDDIDARPLLAERDGAAIILLLFGRDRRQLLTPTADHALLVE